MKVSLKRKDNKKEYIYPFTVDNFDCEKYKHKFTLGKRGKNYVNTEAYLDLETSHIEKDGILKQWIYQWAFLFGKTCIVGRTVEELMQLLVELQQTYQLNENRKLLIYVHNLSYDWSTLESFLTSQFVNETGLLTDVHKPLYMDYDGLEFRCSYRLTGLSLDLLSKNYSSTYIKATGTIDYSKVIYPDDKLDDVAWTYMLNDVYAQRDGVHGFLKSKGIDSPFFSELTITGFVRKSARKSSRTDRRWFHTFQKTSLPIDTYKRVKKTFMGGYTHGNRYYADETINIEDFDNFNAIEHRDFGSSYPATQYMEYFPIGQHSYYGIPDSEEELEELVNNYCCLFDVILINPKLKKEITMPYIPISKCTYNYIEKPILDNGKLLYLNGALRMSVCELDYKIIKNQYEWDEIIIPNDVIIWERGLLPDWFRNTVKEFYNVKTTLKGVKGEELEYLNGKAQLNSLFGMSSTDIIKNNVHRDFAGDWAKELTASSDEQIQEQLEKFYKSRNNFLPYQWSVWTTAHSRFKLFEAIDKAGYENVLYCDTDSIFYLTNEEIEKTMNDYNNYLINKAKSFNAYAYDINGNCQYLGDFKSENDNIVKFRFLHSKCYGFENNEGKLKLIIAGVTASGDIWEDGKHTTITREEELQTLDNLTEGFIFKHCGGVCCKYVQLPITTEVINGHKVTYGNAGVLVPVTKELSALPEVDEETGLPIVYKLN